MGEFNDFVKRKRAKRPPLPMAHTAPLNDAKGRNVFASRRIDAKFCDVFKESLVYFFYGRPAYRIAEGFGARSDHLHTPVCFVLKPGAIRNSKRIFPFDSGAFSRGLFTGFMPSGRSTLDQYLCIGPNIPQKVVNFFFGNNEAYFTGKARTRNDVPDGVIGRYYTLISANGESMADDRRSAIEIQVDSSICLTEENVLAIVLVNAAYEEPQIKNVIDNIWKAKPLTYPTIRWSRPAEYNMVIPNILYQFLKHEGML